jgi:tetratricopeptide (TPR) repeat protein/nucleoside phosphorylase
MPLHGERLIQKREGRNASMPDSSPTPSSCEVIILTALPVERQAVLRHLQEPHEVIHPSGTIYHRGRFTGTHRSWRVVVAEIGMGGIAAALEAEKAISFFQARIAFFVGIAGGLKDVSRGDVVVATKVYAYESGKAAQHFEPRPELGYSSHALEQRARDEARQKRWLARLDSFSPDTTPRVFIGALAAGEKVLASTRSSLSRLLKKTYGDALAIEMEGHGFLHAIRLNSTVHGLVIRGISDLIDDKPVSDAAGWQQVAAQHAAAFAFQVLATFTLPSFDGPSSPVAPAAVWNVPYRRNPYFTGRDELLDRLAQQLSLEPQDDRTTTRRAALTQPQAIQGLGGIGKTQIAVEYAYRSRELNRYTHIFWVNAASEEALLTDFVQLAELLPAFPATGETDQRKLVEAIKRWLEQCQERWLLIFDNADEVALVRAYLPRRGLGSIVLTTRAHAVGSLATPIEVDTMGWLEGTQLLLRRAQRFEHASEEEVNQAGNIVVALDHFPLALDQAGAYLEETQCSFADYLALYQTHRQALLAQRGTLSTDYPHSVATTWSLSFQKVQQKSPAAAELLELCSFLAPDRIPEELLRDGAAYWPAALQQAVADPLRFQQLMADLLKFSLVKRLEGEQALSIHRLVQAVQRDRMERETQHHWAERVVRALNAVFPRDPQDLTTWPQCLKYLDQAQVCHALIEQYGFAFVEAASILNRTGFYLKEHALYALAEPLYQRALAICEQQLGAEHPDTATILDNLAVLYRAQGKYEQAEPLYQCALAIYEQHLGAEHPETAISLNNLAELYHTWGKYERAEPLFQRALAIRERKLGATHPDTAASLDNLALFYYTQGKFEQAEPLHQRALAIREQQLGAMHPDTATSLDNLAALYRKQGKYEQAEPLFKHALLIREQQLGAAHPDTATSLDNLAALYREQDKYEQAEPLHQRALVIREQQLGATHLDTATSLNNLALLYYAQGRYEEAEPLFKRALLIYEQQLGATHPHTATSLDNLALLYRKQGKYEQAESLFKHALAIYEQQFGATHPDTATSLNNLAGLYYAQGKFEQAEPLFQRALVIYEQQLGARHLATASNLYNLALLYKSQGRYNEAEPLYQRALTIVEQQLGREHPTTQTIRKNYAVLLRKMGREADAMQSEADS